MSSSLVTPSCSSNADGDASLHSVAGSYTSNSHSDKLSERVLSCNTKEGLPFLSDIWPDDCDQQPHPPYQTNHPSATCMHWEVMRHLQRVREQPNGVVLSLHLRLCFLKVRWNSSSWVAILAQIYDDIYFWKLWKIALYTHYRLFVALVLLGYWVSSSHQVCLLESVSPVSPL